MSRLAGIGVRRLRALYDLGTPIALTGITVLIGRNSAGKSTFARLLPLLRQSAERKKRAPILWFGDLVDFGTITNAVTRGEHDLELTFDLEGIEPQRGRYRATYWGDTLAPNVIDLRQARVSLTLAGDEEAGATYAKELVVEVAGTKIDLTFESTGEVTSIRIGNRSLSWDKDRMLVRVEQGSILPRVVFLERKKAEERVWQLGRNPWRGSVGDTIHRFVHGKTSRGTTAQIASHIPLAEPQVVAVAMSRLEGPSSWISMRNSGTNSYFVKEVVVALLTANIDTLLERLDDALEQASLGVRYLKPLRATAERYYRRADLSVAEIDPEGRNLPMFLDSLTPWQLESFKSWLKSSLDIEVIPRREGAQIVLEARSSVDSGVSNVADMGFGISQVLPIAAQLWASKEAQYLPFGSTSFLVVEQPELHLHPAFQARLADLLAGVVRDGKLKGSQGPRLVIETHSQHLVNRLGLLVEAQQLEPSDVSVVLFEPDRGRPGTSTARISTFDSTGVLQNWPFGFFEPDL